MKKILDTESMRVYEAEKDEQLEDSSFDVKHKGMTFSLIGFGLVSDRDKVVFAYKPKGKEVLYWASKDICPNFLMSFLEQMKHDKVKTKNMNEVFDNIISQKKAIFN